MALTNPFTHDNRVYREASALVREGYEVTIVAIKDYGSNLPDEEAMGGIKVIRLEGSPEDKRQGVSFLLAKIPKIPSKLLFGGNDSFKLAKLLVKQKADIYHAHDLDTLAAAYWAARLNKARLVYDSHEIFLETSWVTGFGGDADRSRFESYVINLARKFSRFSFAIAERILISRCDVVITVNQEIAKYLQNKYHLKCSPTVLMNCSVLEKSEHSEKLRKILRIQKNKKIVLFQGGFQWGRGLEQLVESVKFWKNKNAVLVLMGGGYLKETLERLIERSDVGDRVFFLASVLPKELLSFTSSADLGVIPYRNVSLNNYLCSPNKVFEYMMAGLPMVVSDFPILRSFAELGIGFTFNPEDPKSIATAIDKVLGNDRLREKMSRTALDLARTKYNWEVEEKKLFKVYKEL